MSAAAEVFVKFTADLSGLTSGFADAANKASKLGDGINTAAGHWVDANGRMHDANGRFIASNKEASDSASGLGSMLDGIAKKVTFAAAAWGAWEIAKKSINLSAELEQNKVAFTTMLGSADKAQKLLGDLATFAANTPFELRGLTDASKKLLAFGFQAQTIVPMMTAIGNAVSAVGGGKDVIDGVTMAIGQMAAKGKVSAEEMNQLAERGIPAWKMLADGIGKSVPEAMKLAEKGAIDANTAINAILNGMNAKFPGMMAKQAQTFNGAMSNLIDSFDAAMTKFGDKLISGLNLVPIIQGLSLAVGNLTKAFVDGGLLGALDMAFGPASKALIIGMGSAITVALIPTIVEATVALGAMAAAAVAAALPYAPLAAAGLAVAAAAYVIIKNWDKVKEVFAVVANVASEAFTWLRNKVSDVFASIGGIISAAMNWAKDKIVSILGPELAAKIGVGLSAAGSKIADFGKWTADSFHAVSAGTVAIANTISGDFTGAFHQAATSMTASVGKIDVGLKTVAASSGKSGKAAADAHKAATAAAKEHAAEVKNTEAAWKAFQLRLLALGTLGKNMEDVNRQSERLGNSFDLAGAKAQVLAKALPSIESAFGKLSPLAAKVRDAIHDFTQQSDEGGKITADAFKLIADGANSLEAARQKAKFLGKEWDDTSESLKAAENVYNSLIDKGLKPGNAAFDEAAANFNKMKIAADAAKNPFVTLRSEVQNMINAVGSLGSNIKTLADAFGIDALKPIADSINTFVSVVGAIIGITTAIEAATKAAGAIYAIFQTSLIPALVSVGSTIMAVVVPAVSTLGAALLANPIGLIVAGIAALIIAGETLYENWDTVSAKLKDIWAGITAAGIAAFSALTDGVSQIWNGLTGIVRGAVNAMIGLVNTLIRGMNHISITMPDWVPNIGGYHFGVNIPQVPYLATGGMVVQPTFARLGEGGRNEAVLPLNDSVFQQIAEGIANQGGGGMQVVVNYTGNGKWTREDAQGLGRLLVSELRSMGVRA